jgi:RNA polymerase sigma-B factor
VEGKAHLRPAVGPADGPGGTDSGDAVRQELVRSHLPLVRAMARRYARRREEFDDLVQAGSVGLVKAATRFDPARGVAFATFVTPSVEGEIRRQLRERSKGTATVSDPVADEHAAESAADAQALAASEIRVLLAGGLRTLDSRERRIVFLRFNADMTERQIAQEVGISQAHVSRLLERALIKLRAELTSPRDQPGDSTENPVISADREAKIEPVGAGEKGREQVAPTESRRSSKPRTATGYSGRILVRMPSELHEQLAAAAEREDISLNRYVNDALSSSVDGATDGADRGGRRRSVPALRLALATNLVIVVVAGVVAVVLLVLALQRGI